MSVQSPSALAARPAADEYAPYYETYLAQLPDGDVLATLERQLDATLSLLDGFGEGRASYRYAPGKWSVKEVVGHMVDTERVFAYRGLCAARGETAALPGFDENAWVAAADFGTRPLNALMAGVKVVRRNTLSLFHYLDDEALARRAVANGHPLSARAAAWIIAGHELHHQRLLRDRYLEGATAGAALG